MRSASSTFSSSSWNGSTSLDESSSSSSTASSTAPVGSWSLRVASLRGTSCPRARTTHSSRSACADGVRLGRALGVHHELHDARAVAQVDEDEAAVIAPPADPARERQLAARVLRARLTAQHVPDRRSRVPHAPLDVVDDVAERDLGLSVPDDATRAVAGAADRDHARAAAARRGAAGP